MNNKSYNNILDSCRKAMNYAEDNDYAGYSKYDGLNSPILDSLSFHNPYLRLIYTQIVMRSPINIRPILSVKKSRNPKGIGLFAMSYLNLYKTFNDNSDKEKAESLLSWLMDNYSQGYSGKCWGYNFAWQSPGFYAPKYMPNLVVTSVIGQAFVKGYEVLRDDKYLDTARSAVDFILKDLKVLFESGDMKCISYVPADTKILVLNVNAQAAALMINIYKNTKEELLLKEAYRLINYVVDKKTNYGGWYYTYPPGDSPIVHDNYHTGNIIDSLIDYSKSTGDPTFDIALRQGLEYYYNNLFLENGAPKFMNNREYPYDIHGAAQSIVTFSKASYLDRKYYDMALKVAEWAITYMQDKSDGHFYYQVMRLYTKRFPLMRWAQAWMAKGLSKLLITTKPS
ncbi:MAG: hypothetical protein ACE5EA_10480 [Nitrospirota bacterium]